MTVVTRPNAEHMTYGDALDIEQMVIDYFDLSRKERPAEVVYTTTNGLEVILAHESEHIYRLAIHGHEMVEVYFDTIDIGIFDGQMEIEGFIGADYPRMYTTAFISLILDKGLESGEIT